jgi:predicted GTPase
MSDEPTKLVICGAGGRDFHNFNVAVRDDPRWQVVAFTAAQIPGIDDRRYPAELAGPRYPDGIPIVPEADLERVCRAEGVTAVMFAYSDVSHGELMALGSRALALGADFLLLGPSRTMLSACRPVIAVSAVRTGCGKSQVARYLARSLTAPSTSRRCAWPCCAIPCPTATCRRSGCSASPPVADIDAADCTLEEREEYEPHVAAGGVLFAGVDYAAVLAAAEAEADVIIWDGGNNDFPFLHPDLHVVVTDALRPDQITGYYPGEAVLRAADVVVINKVDAAGDEAASRLAGIAALLPEVPRCAPARRWCSTTRSWSRAGACWWWTTAPP